MAETEIGEKGPAPVVGEGKKGYEPQGFENWREKLPKIPLRTKIGLWVSAGISAAAIALACKGDGNGPEVGYVPVGNETPTVVAITPTEETTIPGTNIPKPDLENTVTPTPAETPTAKATETPTPAEDPILGRYDRLASNIKSAEISVEDKAKYLAEVEKYEDVERVQARFLEAYHSAVGPDGKTPELLYYLKQKWPAMPDFSAEDQIFFIRNESMLEGFIRPKIEGLAANFSKAAADEIFLAIDQKMANVGYDGKLYFGAKFSMSDYTYLVHPETLPKTEVDYSNLNPAQKAKIDELQTKLAPLVGKFRIVSQNAGETVSSFNPVGEVHVLEINFGDSQTAAHELAHAEDLLLRDTYLPPEMLVRLYTLREKALSDADGGRRYSSVEELFSAPYKAPNGAGEDYTIATEFGNISSQDTKDVRRPSNMAMSAQKFNEIVGVNPAAPSSKKYFNAETFLAGEKETLDKLAAQSPYFKMVLDWFRKNPGGVDNLIKKTVIYDKYSMPASLQGRDGYFEFLKYGSDGIFTTALINGEKSAVEFYSSLDAKQKSDLAYYVLLKYEQADYETWAVMSGAALTNSTPAHQNYGSYYAFLRENSPR